MHIEFYLRFRTVFGQALSIKTNLLLENGEPHIVPMQYHNAEFWKASLQVPVVPATLNYHYLFTNEKGEVINEGEKWRSVEFKKRDKTAVAVIDTWNAIGAIENAFYTAPFTQVFLKNSAGPKLKGSKNGTHIFKVKAPLLKANECVCIVGSDAAIGAWDVKNCFLLDRNSEWHTAALDLSATAFPINYKYGIYNYKRDEFVLFESGENRSLNAPEKEAFIIIHDGFVRLPTTSWKGAGVAIPVFSLRSQNSFGVGEFCDIKLLADWAALIGLKIIQLLPINDTSATFTAQDSYPYAAISAFALHPVYINLQKVAGKKYAASIKSLQKKGKQLNALPEVDYEQVMHYKMNTLRELYDMQGDDFLSEPEYKAFFAANAHWLKGYAAFCYYRDKAGTADFTTWKSGAVYNEQDIGKLAATKTKTAKEIRFYYFVQYHLHLQLTEAVSYAHKKDIALKGDIPIGIFRNSVDAWMAPELYNMNWQAGAPPDDFAVKGQNWGFPTYNWQKMQEDGFDWWRQRFEQMSLYFDAFRIDHILGFFRIWSIPMDAVEGILGRFVPALPIHINEFNERGIYFEKDRFCKPYITGAVLYQLFGDKTSLIKETFLEAEENGSYNLKEAFNTQQKLATYFENDQTIEDAQTIKQGLFDLISNVLLFEEKDSAGQGFHFRISIEHTTSFQHLDNETKNRLKDLYVDYFYRRQDFFWKEEALRKLPALKEATNMLICGEDLGMVPHSVPGVMKDLGILSLEIQRMPKDPQVQFFHPKNAPYLSVVTPSTHDMSTIRGWWEEDRHRTQQFYNVILESYGEAPYFCEPWINRAIVLQHLYSPAMWSIFQLQDLLGMSENLRRQNPHEERINQPADPKHYWQYRMHLTLEQLIKEESFNAEVKDYIINSGRN